MVNFNNEATVGTPAVDIERISILQRRYDFIEALEDYRKNKLGQKNSTIVLVRVRLMSLFWEIQPMLKRRLGKDYDLIEKTIDESKDEKELIKAFKTMNEELDKIHLTKIDTQRVYDSLDVEAENEEKGF